MLGDRGVVDDAGSIAMPDSIQALIAARLDALTPAQRSLLQDAAVVGDHFWSGAVASMNTSDVDVEERLRELQRRGMIRRSSTQTIDGQDELSFSHGLVRDVAYKQIPRAGRVHRHLAVARWLEETAATGSRIAPSRSRTTRPRRSRWHVRPTCRKTRRSCRTRRVGSS